MKNNEFRNWDTNAKPANWDINEAFDVPEDYVVDRDTLDLLLKGDKDKRVYISQTINVTPHTYYLLEGHVATRLRNGSNCGFIIYASDNKVLGKRIFETRQDQNTKLVFNSGETTKINFYLGYITEGIGEISIKSISLKKIDLNNSVFQSEIGQYLFNTFKLQFNKKQFDDSVWKLVKNISAIMLASKRKDTLNVDRRDTLLKYMDESSFLKSYLEDPNDQITRSYASKLVFSANEILSLFNIGSRVIEFRANNKRVHLALMYHNPYINEWVTIDPFYNSKINVNSNFESITKDQVLYLELGGLITYDTPGLLKKYNTSKATVQREKILSHPF